MLQIRNGYWVAIPWISNHLRAFPTMQMEICYFSLDVKWRIPRGWKVSSEWRTIRCLRHIKIRKSWSIIQMNIHSCLWSRSPQGLKALEHRTRVPHSRQTREPGTKATQCLKIQKVLIVLKGRSLIFYSEEASWIIVFKWVQVIPSWFNSSSSLRDASK